MAKLNYVNLKTVCSYYEEHLEIDHNGDFIPINLNDPIPFRNDLPEITDSEFYFLTNQLADNNVLSFKLPMFISDSRRYITGITPFGYEFINKMNQSPVSKLIEIAASSVPALISCLMK